MLPAWLCWLALPFVATLERPSVCYSCVRESVKNRTAIGFHLGQSYGTSVSYLSNGTAINLAKVPGNQEYMKLMESLMRRRFSKYRQCRYFGDCTVVEFLLLNVIGIEQMKRQFGLARDAAILAKMLAQLKSASEEALGPATKISRIALTVPWMAYWMDDSFGDSDLVKAASRAGLGLGLDPGLEQYSPMYIGESQAVLGGNGIGVCRPSRSGGMYEDTIQEDLFLISFTNRSLYTTLNSATCFFRPSWEHTGEIDNDLGLDQLDQAASPAQFWNRLRTRLNDRARGFFYERRASKLFILVAGEAASHPDFERVIREVAQTIQEERHPQMGMNAGANPQVELIIPEDPVFIGAQGAALWERLRIERWSYCDTEECFFGVTCCNPGFFHIQPFGDDDDDDVNLPWLESTATLPEKEL